jgi:hypothetical protein
MHAVTKMVISLHEGFSLIFFLYLQLPKVLSLGTEPLSIVFLFQARYVCVGSRRWLPAAVTCTVTQDTFSLDWFFALCWAVPVSLREVDRMLKMSSFCTIVQKTKITNQPKSSFVWMHAWMICEPWFFYSVPFFWRCWEWNLDPPAC